MNKQILLLYISVLLMPAAIGQNIGIGTNSPESKLHVNGDLKLQNGFAVSKFSRDSLFTENSHNNVPTEKAIKDYLQKGIWGSAADSNTIGTQAPLARGVTNMFLDGPTAVAKQGNYAYVTSSNTNQLACFNVSNPDSIYFRDEITTNLDGPVDVHVQGNYAYVVSENNDRLSVYDISNPANLIAKGFTSTNIRRPTSVFVQGNYAYVTSNLFNRLSIYDISNPDAIIAKGYTSANMSLPVDVFVAGNFAYLVSVANNRLCIYDISNPDAIVAKGFTSAGLTSPVSVHVTGNYAYILTRDPGMFSSYISIFNISNPDVILPAGGADGEMNQPRKLHISGNALFITGDNASVRLYDIANPVALKFVGESSANLQGPNCVFASGDYAYVTSYYNNRLCVFDLNKSNPVQVTPGGVQTMPLQWQTNQNNIYRSNGNVGIGTSVPIAKLDVAGQLLIEQHLTGGLGGLLIKGNAPGSNYPNIAFSVNSGNTGPGEAVAALIQGDVISNTLGSETIDMTFYTSETGSFGIAERLRIKGNGNVGIGTATPANKLTIAGNTDITGNLGVGNSSPSNRLSVTGNANITGNLGIGNISPAKPLSFPATLGEKILLYPGGAGEVGIGVYGNELRLHCDNPGSMVSFGTQDNAGVFTQAGRFQISAPYALYVNGSIWANGTTYASDERFKKNITTIKSPLQKLLQINGVEYEMKAKEFSRNQFRPGRQIGLLAQNVETVVPEAVNEQDGYKGVDYARLVPLLIESIKEQQQQITEQQRQIDELKRKMPK